MLPMLVNFVVSRTRSTCFQVHNTNTRILFVSCTYIFHTVMQVIIICSGICANPSGPMLVLVCQFSLFPNPLPSTQEYMRRGDLGKLLRDRKCFEVDWIKRGRSIVAGIANGLCFLHTQAHPIVHRDVLPH